MKLSVLVVTYNDERRLRECLAALSRFEERIVVDLGSSDRSTQIARDIGVDVYKRQWVPAVEFILPDVKELTRNAWILRVDPDEILSSELVDDLLALEVGDEYGMVTIPFQYYFLNRRLDTTVWGGIHYGSRVFHKERTVLETEVHRTHQCKEGFKTFTIKFTGGNAVAHYWVDSIRQLFSKHERYLRLEGQSRFSKGEVFSWGKLARQTWENFKVSFIYKSGWRGGWVGLVLSLFYAQYEARGWLSLRQYESSQSQLRD